MNRNATPYPTTTSFLQAIQEGMVPQDRYYATLSAWLKDGTALTTRGPVIKKLATEQWKQGIMNVVGTINWSQVDRQTPHYLFNQEEDYTMIPGGSDTGATAIYERKGGPEREQNRKLLGCPHIDRETIHSPYYNKPKGKTRTVYDSEGFADPTRN